MTLEQKSEVLNKVKEYPEISRIYENWLMKVLENNDPRGYPLVKQFLTGNKTYLSYFEEVLKQLSTVKGFKSIVKQSKNKIEFYDELSVLRLGLILRSVPCTFEFLPQGKTAMPDIRADLWKKDAYFEVKHLKDIDEIRDILRGYFAEYPSSFVLSIIFNEPATTFQTKQLVEKIKNLIETNREKIELYVDLDFAEVRIIPSKERKETPLAVTVGIAGSPLKNTYRKIEMLLSEAIRQFRDIPLDSPAFASIDIEKLLIDSDDLEPILYGEKNLCKPLFSAAGSEIINGVIWMGQGKPVLYVNPKVDARKYVDCSNLSAVLDVRTYKIGECSV